MRRSKIITIDGRGEVVVKEISAWGVYTAWVADDRLAELRALIDDAANIRFKILPEYDSSIDPVTNQPRGFGFIRFGNAPA